MMVTRNRDHNNGNTKPNATTVWIKNNIFNITFLFIYNRLYYKIFIVSLLHEELTDAERQNS